MIVERERTPVSIVCVYNNPDVLESCLARSIRAGLADAPDTEFIPVDNRRQTFTTAGAALNAGAHRARNDVIVFVHQDVVLHSLETLERAAAVLQRSPDIGVLGAVGMDSRDRVIGRVRDRVVQIGEGAPEPREVDSLDEVLFMAERHQVLREPLSEDSVLAWHAYGVEYCLRVRRAGMRACAMDLAVTHNSLTINLDKLDLAHRHVGDTYSELLPIRTTCGIVWAGDGPGGMMKSLRRSRGAAIWWNESLTARSLARTAGARDVVLADVRVVIDDAARLGGRQSIRVVDVAASGLDTSVGGLTRFGVPFSVETSSVDAIRSVIATRDDDELLLIAGLREDDLSALGPLTGIPHVVGHSRDTGRWVLIGVASDLLSPLWSHRRNLPFAGLLPAAFRAVKTSR